MVDIRELRVYKLVYFFIFALIVLCLPYSQDKFDKVSIQWDSVLQDVLNMVGGSEAVYTHERSDGMVEVCVHFRVPLDKSGSLSEDVEAHGIRCPEMWQAGE